MDGLYQKRKKEGDAEVDGKPRILMYSHDSYGLGHLRRTLGLAKAFVEHDPGLGVLILTGSTVSGAFRMPQGIDIVKLPSAVKVSNGVYKPGRLPITFEHLRKLRSGLILNTDRKSTRLNSSHANISYAVFCLKKKKTKNRL